MNLKFESDYVPDFMIDIIEDPLKNPGICGDVYSNV